MHPCLYGLWNVLAYAEMIPLSINFTKMIQNYLDRIYSCMLAITYFEYILPQNAYGIIYHESRLK